MKAYFPAALCALSLTLSAQESGIYVSQFSDHQVSIIDPSTMQIIHTIDLPIGSNPDAIVTDSLGRVYVATDISPYLLMIDPSNQYSVSSVSGIQAPPGGLALDGATALFVAQGDSNTVAIVDTTTNQSVTNLLIPGMFDLISVAWDGATGMYVTDNSSVKRIGTTSLTAGASLLPISAGNYLAWDGATGMYVSTDSSDWVAIIDTLTQTFGGTVSGGTSPFRMAWDGGTGMYVGNLNTVSVINTQTLENSNTISAGTGPAGMVWNGGTGIYVSEAGSDQVSVIDTSIFQVVSSTPVPGFPFDVTIGNLERAIAPVTSAPIILIFNALNSSNATLILPGGQPVSLFTNKPTVDIPPSTTLDVVTDSGSLDINLSSGTVVTSGDVSATIQENLNPPTSTLLISIE